MTPLASRFKWPFIILCVSTAYGILGYTLIEKWDLLDSTYMTIITLATVGFGEVHPLTDAGRVFTISLIMLGLTSLVATVQALAEVMATGQLFDALRTRRMHGKIEKLEDHYVICAFGRVGQTAADEFREQGAEFMAIEIDEALIPLMEEQAVPYIIGNPSKDSVLIDAGIERAKGLVCAVDSDATNVYITLTARALNPKLSIVARASNPESVDKLYRAGADRVVSPYALSGQKMAYWALRPSVVDFVDMVTIAPHLRLEEVEIGENSHLCGRTIDQACSTHPGVFILALKKQGQELQPSPRQDTTLNSGDLLIALGPNASLQDMNA
ncbi:MAG: potassium channel protein [Actinomycetota bacterium]